METLEVAEVEVRSQVKGRRLSGSDGGEAEGGLVEILLPGTQQT